MTNLRRALRVGARVQRLRRAYDFGLGVELRTLAAKRRYLKDVSSLVPVDAGSGGVDCFMLLNEPRIWEGVWALYSFRTHFGPCRLTVLNDGTLSARSIALLSSLFPGIDVPAFAANETETAASLSEAGLRRCREWRERFVFFRKLIDPFRLARSEKVVLLDSDCLHFRPPVQVQQWARTSSAVRFIADVRPDSFCASPQELARICGVRLPEFFCAGFLCVPRDAIDLARVERYLSEDIFERQLSTGRFAHVAEQSLFAMEAARRGAERLPAEYATCPDVPGEDATMGHFCGGSQARTWFYTKGLPLVRATIADPCLDR